MKLSILIVNWNSKDYLRECLRTIHTTCSNLSIQVVVVDGGSFDGCAEMLAADFPEIEFIQSDENIGFGRSNNLGLAAVTGDLLLLLNPDTELRPGALSTLIETLIDQPDAGLVGARLLNSDGSLQYSSVHLLPTPWNIVLDSDWTRRRWWRLKGLTPDSPPCEVESVSGACMLLHTETFHNLGGFDPAYFMYSEDIDLCARVRAIGKKIYLASRATVVHHGGGSSRRQFSEFSTVMIREAVHHYLIRHNGRACAYFARTLIAMAALARITCIIPLWLFAAAPSRAAKTTSLRKWTTVLRWCAGLESWASGRFGGCPTTEIQTVGKSGWPIHLGKKETTCATLKKILKKV
jgi:N-acetylglucosaminyl-diphospho-decaprenol L-rhamnosyltransferase